MYILRAIFLLIFSMIIVGCCGAGMRHKCNDDYIYYCPMRCVQRDCGPTVEQIGRIKMIDKGWFTCDRLAPLRAKDVQIISIGDNLIILLPEDKFFEFGCATIYSNAYLALSALADYLRCHRYAPLYISGHTDNVAGRAYNCLLSDQRAQAIRAYLWVRGVPFRIMSTTGCGNAKPIANQVTIAGNQANRRIEIRVRRTGYCPR
jgi:outer membrane protein OmpA-like peptidoglycan-associated protein